MIAVPPDDDPFLRAITIASQVFLLVVFVAGAIVTGSLLVSEPGRSPYDTIRWAGSLAGFLAMSAYLIVGLVQGRPVKGRSLRLDVQIAAAWVVFIMAVASSVLAVAVARGDWLPLTGSLVTLVATSVALRRTVQRLVDADAPSPAGPSA